MQTGDVVADRYRLEAELGRGGMGSVWRAHHVALDVACAVKFIEGDDATMPELRVRFAREARAAAKLKSPNVVSVLDHGEWQGVPYLAMELLEGEDLAARLKHRGRLSAAALLRIVEPVARALDRAHALGIVHRDLKPENIFLVKDGPHEVVKIVDFGIAKMSGLELAGSKTRTGALLGTPYYMSPEQADGTKPVDGRSDLWALAVLSFEALTGVLPFDGDALGDLLMKIMSRPIPIPSQVAPDVPAGFDAFFAKGSARDPNDRFQSGRELTIALAASLGLALSEEPLSERDPPSAQGPVSLRIDRHATPNARTALGAATPRPTLTLDGQTRVDPPPRTRPRVFPWVIVGSLGMAAVIAVLLANRGEPNTPTADPVSGTPHDTTSPAAPILGPAVEPQRPPIAANPSHPELLPSATTAESQPSPPPSEPAVSAPRPRAGPSAPSVVSASPSAQPKKERDFGF